MGFASKRPAGRVASVCGGRAWVSRPLGTDDPTLGLASSLGELEASGPVSTVWLRVARRGQWTALERALGWLADHGRRPVVRLAIPAPNVVVESLRTASATVMLELAHPRAEVQRALLGGDSSPAAALLLHAQQLAACGVPTGAWVGPLYPGVHESSRSLAPLFEHARTAGIRDAHVSVGGWAPGRMEALAQALPVSELVGIVRGFGVVPGAPVVGDRPRLPAALERALLEHGARGAAACSVAVDACGCPAQCHLDPRRSGRPYVSLRALELFQRRVG